MDARFRLCWGNPSRFPRKTRNGGPGKLKITSLYLMWSSNYRSPNRLHIHGPGNSYLTLALAADSCLLTTQLNYKSIKFFAVYCIQSPFALRLWHPSKRWLHWWLNRGHWSVVYLKSDANNFYIRHRKLEIGAVCACPFILWMQHPK